MLHFISRRLRPVVSVGLDAEGLAALKAADETVFVAYLDSSDRKSAGVFEVVARKYRDEFSFATVVDSEVAESQGQKASAVVCYRIVDGDEVSMSGLEGVDELDKWYVLLHGP